jgi:pimeloyl-ACP methyl ester carboxylesterase
MPRAPRIASFAIVLAVAALSAGSAVGCSEDKPSATTTAGDGGTGAVATLDTPALPCADAVDAIYADPGALAADPTARGKILACSRAADIPKATLQSEVTRLGYTGAPLTSGARVYKIQYRTERGDAKSTPSVSSAFVMIPDVPRAAKVPVIVASRGSRGQAAKCAVTKLDPALTDINDDFYRQAYGLVGSGYALVAPDLAGYAAFGKPGNPPSAFGEGADVGRSTIDGARALKSLFPALDDKVVLVGHSQGGQTTLSALALAADYGLDWPIVGAALYAPLWFSQRSWGTLLNKLVGRNFPIATSLSITNVAVWYHYLHAELLDGPGEGVKLFAADKRDAVKAFVEGECWGSAALAKLGVQYTDELFDPAFVASAGSGAVGANCDGDAVCEKWVARYAADRPHLTGKAGQTPLFLAYGAKDTTIPPDRMQCGYDRLLEDKVNLTVCGDPALGHGEIVSAKADIVSEWIASVALGAPAPAACAATAKDVLTAKCASPPPND